MVFHAEYGRLTSEIEEVEKMANALRRAAIMRFALATGAFAVSSFAHSGAVEINWADIGGPDQFERQAINFAPIKVDSFVKLETEGEHLNLIDTFNSFNDAKIFLRIAGVWEDFATLTGLNGSNGSSFSLDSFVFKTLDFSRGPVSGINFTNQAAGATNYRSMNSGIGTTFYFDIDDNPVNSMPTPGTFALFGIGIFGVGYWRRKIPFTTWR